MSREPDLPQDRPQVTVFDPLTGQTARADVVGDDREPRRLPRWVAPFALGALVAALAVPPAASAVRDERREDRAAAVLAEEKALDDQLALVVSDPHLSGHGGSGQLQVTAVVFGTAERDIAIEALELRGEVTGDAPVAVERATVGPGLPPASLEVGLQVDCTRAADALRTGGSALQMGVVVRATPGSGRQQSTEPLPLPEDEVRTALARTCDLDEYAEPLSAVATVIGDRLVVAVTARPSADVTVLGHRAYGLILGSPRSVPFVVRRGTTVRTELEVVRLAGCEGRKLLNSVIVLLRAADGSTAEIEVELVDPESAWVGLTAGLRREPC